jgi:hypothetical protein
MSIQTVLIPTTYTLEEAVMWLLDNGFQLKKVDATEKYWRFRQNKPDKNASYHTKSLSNGVRLVFYN